ncbi:MAG: response regulator, partial [Clostridia bacterium]
MLSKTVLIIDDNKINRTVLCKILSTEYDVLEAENGVEAFNIIEKNKDTIIAITLDLIMPEMDGYEFLNIVSRNDELSNIPIIVTTGNKDDDNEIKVLEMGAWDFVPKPYNPKILKFRLKNAIQRSRLAALEKLKYLAEYDSLTGIYNKYKFFSATKQMLSNYPEKKFAIVRVDVERFQLINSFYGLSEGDK